jgi:hypothetical protein
MYLARKSNGDGYSFFSKLDLSDKATLHAYRREFLDHTRNGLHGDFDRGYFSAWSDCMRVLTRLNIPADTSAVQSSKEEATAAKKQLETLRSDKSQATIANFLKKKLDDAEEENE